MFWKNKKSNSEFIKDYDDRWRANTFLAEKRAAEAKEQRLNQLEADLLELIDRDRPIPLLNLITEANKKPKK